MAKYKQRIADRILECKVLGKGAVLIDVQTVDMSNDRQLTLF